MAHASPVDRGIPITSVSFMIFPQLSSSLLIPHFHRIATRTLPGNNVDYLGVPNLRGWAASFWNTTPPHSDRFLPTALHYGGRWQTSCRLKRLVVVDNQVNDQIRFLMELVELPGTQPDWAIKHVMC